MEKLIIIGSGPAALTAAIYAARSDLKPLIIEGTSPGGQLMGTTYVENWPATQRITGPELMMNMRAHAQSYNVRFKSGDVTGISVNKPFAITVEKEQLETEALIIATGAEPKKLEVQGESDYWGKGVTTCAVCDGIFYKDRPVIIVGGGDTAMENASFMLNHTKKITIIQIMPELTASPIMQKRVLDNPDIKIHYNSTISEIKGDGKHVTTALITNHKTEKSEVVKTDAVFISIGYKPNTKFLKGTLELDSYGYIKVTNHTKTSVPGIFAAGDVSDYRYRQAITSAGSGCMAAMDAERFLKHT